MSSAYTRRGARPLADLVTGALTPACRRRGFAAATLLMHWPDIVGPAVAAATQPERLVWPRAAGGVEVEDGGAVLVVRADPGAALLLQHTAPQIIERVNTFFGWRAVERLKLVQHHRPRLPRAVPPCPAAPDEADRAAVRATLHPASDERLGEALVRLGANLRARRRASETD